MPPNAVRANCQTRKRIWMQEPWLSQSSFNLNQHRTNDPDEDSSTSRKSFYRKIKFPTHKNNLRKTLIFQGRYKVENSTTGLGLASVLFRVLLEGTYRKVGHI